MGYWELFDLQFAVLQAKLILWKKEVVMVILFSFLYNECR